ncbi:MAG: hypothetical protein IJR49_00680, partial [Treponema sp.]|nr:hypothetical protein [Treponema sp.]
KITFDFRFKVMKESGRPPASSLLLFKKISEHEYQIKCRARATLESLDLVKGKIEDVSEDGKLYVFVSWHLERDRRMERPLPEDEPFKGSMTLKSRWKSAL